MKIVVLMGGRSPEREISLRTGAGVGRALAALGHEVFPLDTGTVGADVESLLRAIPKSTDLAFIALHGGDGENGTVQAFLDLKQMPYTGSGVLASALAMDKAISKRIFLQEGIPTPEWLERWAPEDTGQRWHPEIGAEEIARLGGYPVVVKPNDQGSTVGVTVVGEPSGLKDALETARAYGRLVLIERFIPGREVTVAVLNGRALPVVEIIPQGGFYDYEHKYTAGASRYEVPARLSPEASERLLSIGLRAYRALRASGVARVDFRLHDDGTPYCLEVNTVPGMTEMSLVPKAAAAAGLSYEDLVRAIVESAPLRAVR